MDMPIMLLHNTQESIPKWAFMERQAFAILSQTPQMLQGLLTQEGEFYWPECVKDFQTFAYGNVDNAFEGFSNLPLLYLLGGDDSLLSFSQQELEAMMRQFSKVKKTELGISKDIASQLGRDRMLVDEMFTDMDWMHMAEGNRLLYFLVLANPAHQKNRDRVLKFAQIIFGDNPAGFERNYDPQKHVFKCPMMGPNGPAYMNYDNPFSFSHSKECYGLPFHDVEGVETLMDLKDPEMADFYGKVVSKRQSHSDCLANMYCTTLATYAHMLVDHDEYKNFVIEYMDAWRKRAEGYEYIPDNVGPGGIVGETVGGRFYGGHYGWTLYHGLETIADSMIIGGENERILNGNGDFIDRAKALYNKLVEQYGVREDDGGVLLPFRHADQDAVLEYFGNEKTPMTRPDKTTDNPAYVRRRQVDGWFDFKPPRHNHWQHYYAASRSKEDFLKMKEIFKERDFRLVHVLKGKDKSANDLAYIAYLNGEYDDFPEDALQLAIDTFYRMNLFCKQKQDGVPDPGFGYLPEDEDYRMMRDIASEFRDKYGLNFDETYIYNYYQVFLLHQNVPVEALLQLTMGGMAPVYNGGLLCTDARWFDMDRHRPGLCEDVAVLISEIDDSGYTVTLANIAPAAHTLVLQGGAFGEHNIVSLEGESVYQEVGGKWVAISISGGTVITLKVKLDRYVNQPSLDEPYERIEKI